MTITRVQKNGRQQYSVHWRNPAVPCGYSRSFFHSKAAADAFAESKATERDRFGADWVDLPASDRAEAVQAIRLARSAGIRLTDAVAAAIRAKTSAPSMTVKEVFDACLISKKSQGLRVRSYRDLEGSLRAFQRGRDNAPAASITPRDVEAYIVGLKVSQRRRVGHLVNIQTGFAHAVRMDHLTVNPCAKVPRPVVEAKETSVLTPEQADHLFRVCERDDPQMLGFLALAAFAGFRPESEVARMTRVDVEAGLKSGFLAPPTINKTRRRRLVPVPANLRAWLVAWLPLGVEVVPSCYIERIATIRRTAGPNPWPQNVLRHSRVSYRLAETGSAAQTADEDGHSEAMLHRNYKALVTPDAAAQYFSIMPTPGLDLPALAAAAASAREAGRLASLAIGRAVLKERREKNSPHHQRVTRG